MDSHTAVSVVKRGTRQRLSRYGCRNCKLRKLKCDETKPQCQKCCSFGISCNFGYGVPDLQPLHQQQVITEASRQSQLILTPPRALVSNAIWSSNKWAVLGLDRHDQELFGQFRRRTVHTLGDSAVVSTYETKIFRDSFDCPALMHGILAMSAVHDRYLRAQPTSRRSLREVYHSSQCAVLFKDWLNRPVEEKDKDAIWATAVTLSNLAFSSIDVSPSEDAWPLKPPDPSDLQWLRLKASDKVLWRLADPMRPSSVFRIVSDAFSDIRQQQPMRGDDGVSFDLASICGLNKFSTPENNAHFGFVHALSRLLETPRGDASLGKIFMVVSAISNESRVLLEQKDPVALLLLYLWYTRASVCRWWIDFRARYELPAIRTYLQRYHSDIIPIQELLDKETW